MFLECLLLTRWLHLVKNGWPQFLHVLALGWCWDFELLFSEIRGKPLQMCIDLFGSDWDDFDPTEYPTLYTYLESLIRKNVGQIFLTTRNWGPSLTTYYYRPWSSISKIDFLENICKQSTDICRYMILCTTLEVFPINIAKHAKNSTMLIKVFLHLKKFLSKVLFWHVYMPKR